MIDAICEEIANYTPFSSREIKRFYLITKSIDKTIAACNYCIAFGADLSSALPAVVHNEIELPEERLKILDG